MYARKYYLLYIEEIFYLNIQETGINNNQETGINPSLFTKSHIWPFDLFAIRCIHPIHQIHPVHHSPRSPFTFSLSLFHLFLSIFFPFPLQSPSPFIPLYLTTSGTKTEKIRDNSFVSRKNVLTLQP